MPPAVHAAPRAPGWRRTALYSVLFMMGADMFLTPMLIPAITDGFGTRTPQTALTVVAFGAAYAISSPFLTGLLSNRSSRLVIGVGLPIVVVACLTATFSTDLTMLTAARVASGFGAAMVNPAVWSHLSATASSDTRARVILGGTAASATGQVLGIPLGAMLADASGWREAFAALAIGFLIVWVAAGFAMAWEEPEAGTSPSASGALGGMLDGLRLWRVPTFSISVLGNIGAQAARLGTYSYVGTLFGSRYGFDGAGLGTVGIVAGTGSLIGAAISTATVTWWCRRGWPVLGVALVSTAIMFIGIALVSSPLSAPLSMVGVGLSFAAGIVVFGTSQSFLSSTFPGDRTAVSWNSSAMYIGAAVGTFALGLTDLAPGRFMAVSLAFVVVAGMSFLALVMSGTRHAQ